MTPWFYARPGHRFEGDMEARVELVRRGDGTDGPWADRGCAYGMTASEARVLSASLIEVAERVERLFKEGKQTDDEGNEP